MANRRSQKKLEERASQRYIYQHSVSANRDNDPDSIRERIYTGTADELVGAVLAECKGTREIAIPEIPQGLVISDSRGTGYFDPSNTLEPPTKFNHQ